MEAVKFVAGIFGFFFDQGKDRSKATKGIEKSGIFYMSGFLFSIIIGLTMGMNYRMSIDRFDIEGASGAVWAFWVFLGVGVVMTAVHSMYRARYHKLEGEKKDMKITTLEVKDTA